MRNSIIDSLDSKIKSEKNSEVLKYYMIMSVFLFLKQLVGITTTYMKPNNANLKKYRIMMTEIV